MELERIPYLGGGITATVLTRDKIVAKQILAAHGIPVTRYVAFTREDYVENADRIIKHASEFSVPLFVKPANLGSALGVSMVKDVSQLEDAMQRAMSLDRRALIEEGVKKPRELEVAIMGNFTLYPSPVGEIDYHGEWNDYQTKYHTRPHYIIPANIPKEISDKIIAYALQAYRLLDCTGYGRIDFFMDRETRQIYCELQPWVHRQISISSIDEGSRLWINPPYRTHLVKFALERHPKKEEVVLPEQDEDKSVP